MNWIAYFTDFFRQRSEYVHSILDADGCRERWVQGEMFLHARGLHLKTDATRSRFDLLCPEPPMIAEIKICGGEYAPKMQKLIQDDVRKLERAAGDWERFMILVVDNRNPHTSLGRWLTTCDFPDTQKHDIALSKSVIIRIWRITGEAQRNLGANSSKAAEGLPGTPQGEHTADTMVTPLTQQNLDLDDPKGLGEVRKFLSKPWRKHGTKRTTGEHKGWYEHDWGDLVQDVSLVDYGHKQDIAVAAEIAKPLRKRGRTKDEWEQLATNPQAHREILALVRNALCTIEGPSTAHGD